MEDFTRREKIRQFIMRWSDTSDTREKQASQSYWLSLLCALFGDEDYTSRLSFEKPVYVDGTQKYIDIYIPETRVIIEQKSKGKSLSQKISQSGGAELTPYEQAKRYNNDLTVDEKARWIVTSNFDEIWIYNMSKPRPDLEENIIKIKLPDLRAQFECLNFLLNPKQKEITQEVKLSQEAGEYIGKIYDELKKGYRNSDSAKARRSLNVLCVRLVFCLYADKASMFHHDQFLEFIRSREPKDIRPALLSLFQVLDTPKGEAREDLYVDDELDAFPYVNGGLFQEEVEIPKITQEIKDAIVEASVFQWAEISPTIFGAMFEDTLHSANRRINGMHYTSLENIHKVIDPLFLNDLTAELDKLLVTKDARALREYQNRLANLRFLDPACGSGNFLTETYICIRRLENKVIDALSNYMEMNLEDAFWLKVSIGQFYGIEINDFAVAVAKTALWIAENQMLMETQRLLQSPMDFLPLKTNANIVVANALRMDWNSLVPKEQMSYVYGNPPFVGKSFRNAQQKEDMKLVFKGVSGCGNLDYVTCWYKVATDYIQNTNIRCSFVSTNSICQGIAVTPLWQYLISKKISIDFAYKTFVWTSETTSQAAVFCVIIGFSQTSNDKKILFWEDENKHSLLSCQVSNISPYLVEGPNLIVAENSRSLCNMLAMSVGSCPCGKSLILSATERAEILKKDPALEPYIKPYLGGQEFLNQTKNKPLIRYCLWLKDAPPSILNSKAIKGRIEDVRSMRQSSSKPATQKRANTPHLFTEDRYVDKPSLFIPMVSSGDRLYIPMGFIGAGIVASNKSLFIPFDPSTRDEAIYIFGVLTSNVHMAWMRLITGRLKGDYSYGAEVVYNTFPFPSPTEQQKAKIIETAQKILQIRKEYFDKDKNCSYATLYGKVIPVDLARAHDENNRAVMNAYGFNTKTTTAQSCVEQLLDMYKQLVDNPGTK